MLDVQQQFDESSEIGTREALLQDAPQIGRIWVECLGLAGYQPIPTEDDAISAFESRIQCADYRSKLWVATVDGQVVGWQGLIESGPTQIIRSTVSSTYISPVRHRKGIGRRLLLQAMRYADTTDLDYILGWIRRDNYPSAKLVLSLGWRLVGALPQSPRCGYIVDYYAYATLARRASDLDGSKL